MPKNFYGRIQHKRDTSANWTAINPVLLDGEIIVVVTDSGEVRHKTGDGTKTYTQLPFDDEVVRNLVGNKQDRLTFDESPTVNSSNPVTSGGVAAALEAYSPTFVATYDSTPHSEILAAYNDSKSVLCIKDSFLYGLIACTDSVAIFSYSYGSTINYLREANDTWSYTTTNLQAKLTYDDIPTDSSKNPVTSGGVYNAINNISFVVEQNKGLPQRFWRGTSDELKAVATRDDNTIYITTDEDGNVVPSGPQIPEFTSEDEGKILRIVNGVMAWVSLANAEEANF